MSSKKNFASGWCFDKIFWIFVICSIFGAFWEESLYIIKSLVRYGTFMWSPRRGVLYGPFSPVYGAGAILMVYCLKGSKEKWYMLFLKGALIGGAFEYLISFLQEVFVGTISWDYSNKLLSIGGRTALPYMVSWGILSIFLMKCFYPFICKLIESFSYDLGKKVTKALFVFLVFDSLISWTAILRWTLRTNEVKPITPVGRFYDSVFTDVYMQRHFPNMKIIK